MRHFWPDLVLMVYFEDNSVLAYRYPLALAYILTCGRLED
jgi:hypothetical protein